MTDSDSDDYDLEILRVPETYYKPPPEAQIVPWQRIHAQEGGKFKILIDSSKAFIGKGIVFNLKLLRC